MHHQFWITKKTVQRKLGSKEDECIILSDSELDLKIELFKSLAESSGSLFRIVDQYQERLCILGQEENFLGKHLKENGKNSNTTGGIMLNAGKAICFCSQARMALRPPLLRLLSELHVFRERAVSDTLSTINLMEKKRTEYRAALSWMKKVSSQLDPDSDRALDKFRKAQNYVRLAKAKFDRLSLDCLQKIDLLVAARCNLFSHALVIYISTMLQFVLKSSETFKASLKSFSMYPQYNFNILKELSKIEETNTIKDELNLRLLDSDQSLFFLDEYVDVDPNIEQNIIPVKNLVDIPENVEDNVLRNIDIHLLVETMSNYDNDHLKFYSTTLINPIKTINGSQNTEEQQSLSNLNINKIEKVGKSADWFHLFSELDILSNHEEIGSQIDGHKEHSENA